MATCSILKGTLPRSTTTDVKQPVASTPSVKFLENNTYHGDSKKGPRSKTVQFFHNLCAPLASCRKRTLKRVHCRTVLVAICALVVIECVCVLSELMVDLQGVKFRFENEAQEVNKFVDHFRKKHPEAFDHVDIRRTKDFFQILTTSVVPVASKDFVSPFKCSDNRGSNSNQAREVSNTLCLLCGDRDGDSPRKRPGVRREGVFESPNYSTTPSMPRPTGDSRNSGKVNLPLGSESDGPGWGSEQNVLKTLPDSGCKGRCTTPKDTMVTSVPTRVIATTSYGASGGPRANISGGNITNSKDVDHRPTESSKADGITSDVRNSSGVNGNLRNAYYETNTTVQDAISLSGIVGITRAPIPYQPMDAKTSQAPSGRSAEERKNTTTQTPANHRTFKQTTNNSAPREHRMRRSISAKNKSSTLLESFANMFILEINNDKGNFFMALELLPERMKNNGTNFLKYKDEYKKIYTTSKALHVTSLSILGIMVIETIVKLFCTGFGFFKKKLEVFDALIVVSSFALDVTFLDSRWYETGKDATALLVLLLPWRVVRIVNSFLMTVKHKHHLQMINLKRGKKKAEIKITKLQTLMTEIRKDVQLLTNLCRFHDVDENSINACLYGKGRRGATMDAMTTCASLMIISTLGKDTAAQHEDVYSTVIQQVLNEGDYSTTDQDKKKEAEAALDAAIAMEEKIEARRRSRRPSRLKRALLKRSYTIPRRCASVEISPADEEGCSSNNVFYIHDQGTEDSDGYPRPESTYVIAGCDQLATNGDVFYVSCDGGSAESSQHANVSDL